MKWLVNALSTSVGKKFVMGITGLLLCGFLVVHISGNLLLYAGPAAYNDYANSLHEHEWLLAVAEVGLLLLFLAHIVLAFRTTRENRAARETGYEMKVSKKDNAREFHKLARSDSWMFVSGAVVLAFVLLHLWDFRFEARSDIAYATMQPFEKAVAILQTPLSFSAYIVGSLFLGWHLTHGFASAFQSLGLNHPKFNPLVRWLSLLFAFAVGLGFASFPLWAMFGHSAPAGVP
ncbi:MAG: succinate dehydrogenase cytochrome b subunit [Planctomycetaceae bacterium]